jgi:hypothetical protein
MPACAVSEGCYFTTVSSWLLELHSKITFFNGRKNGAAGLVSLVIEIGQNVETIFLFFLHFTGQT